MKAKTERIAIVTGAAGGIGSTTVRRLVAEGWSVTAVDLAPILAAGHPSGSGDVVPLQHDIAGDGTPELVISATLERFGRVDLLVNNAGIGNAKPVHETTDEELGRFLDVNFASAFRLTREAIRVMRPGSGIVNIASVLAKVGTPATSSYAASKAALTGLTRQMAVEYGPRGIRSNAVAPGLIETSLVSERLRTDRRFQRIWADGTPWPRLGKPEDVAAAVAFLASGDAEFINGHVLVVDGGWSVAAPG